jgi:hypothetical protein
MLCTVSKPLNPVLLSHVWCTLECSLAFGSCFSHVNTASHLHRDVWCPWKGLFTTQHPATHQLCTAEAHVPATIRGSCASHPYRSCSPTTAALLCSECMQCNKIAGTCTVVRQHPGKGTTNRSSCRNMPNSTEVIASRSPMRGHDRALQMFKTTPC